MCFWMELVHGSCKFIKVVFLDGICIDCSFFPNMNGSRHFPITPYIVGIYWDLWGISPFKGLLGGLNSQGTIPMVPAFFL